MRPPSPPHVENELAPPWDPSCGAAGATGLWSPPQLWQCPQLLLAVPGGFCAHYFAGTYFATTQLAARDDLTETNTPDVLGEFLRVMLLDPVGPRLPEDPALYGVRAPPGGRAGARP